MDIEIYTGLGNSKELRVTLNNETVWLTQKQISELFGTEVPAINKHIKNIISDNELERESTVSKMEIVQLEGKRKVSRTLDIYNLDMIISVGYRVNSARATHFRIWATQRLKDYLVQGYSINEKRLEEKHQQVEYLKTGIRILSRAISQQATTEDSNTLQLFAKGLALLDDYDHEQLDSKGKTKKATVYPEVNGYLQLIANMKSDFSSAIFAKPKDNSFDSSIKQIEQSFNGRDLYTSIEEKAAMLLYLVVKNHSFVDGNKRIGAACFLYFLDRNKMLYTAEQNLIITNGALAALTLFVATSKTEEMETVKQLIISILNRR